jgi:hypothetical protein
MKRYLLLLAASVAGVAPSAGVPGASRSGVRLRCADPINED